MTEFFGSIWWLIVSLGILVTFHEFGHYWVARRCGVRVLRFSVGFGRPLWTRRGKDGTEYVVAMLPLGGYVKMLDEREVEVAPHERHESFNAKSVWQRIAIVAAGPVANLLLCIALLWLMFVVGKPDFQPDIGRAEGLAAEAGFQAGDRLLEVDGRPTRTWSEAGIALATARAGNVIGGGDWSLDRLVPDVLRAADCDASVLIRRPDATRPWQHVLDALSGYLVLAQRLHDEGPAQAAGLKVGDRLVTLDGAALNDWQQLVDGVVGLHESINVGLDRGVVLAHGDINGSRRHLLGLEGHARNRRGTRIGG